MRKRKPKVRIIVPDPRYNDPMVTQFVNNMMWEGKKSTAFHVFYDAMDLVKDRSKQDEHALWKKALNNVMPQVEVRSRRIGGATFQIPTEIRAKRKVSNIGIAAHIDAGKTTTLSVRSTTPVSTTKLAKYTKVLLQWTGWSRSRSVVSPSLLPLPNASGSWRPNI
jgi:ribosomal protein S7